MKSWLNIAGKVVIVTGGSSGIGEAIVEELLEQEVKVANFDIQDNGKKHPSLLFLKTDVTSKNNIEQSVQTVIHYFGTIDGVVNNAGINIPRLLVDGKEPKSLFELTEESFDKMVTINQKSLFLVSQAVGRILVENKEGIIINMSSESGLEGSEGQSIYASTKAAAYSLTRSWAKELGKYNIRVIGIAPGIMEATGLRTAAYEEALAYTRGITVDELQAGYSKTTTIPLGRSGKLREVADLVCFYLSERSSYVTGITTNISGGKTRG